MRRLIWLGLWLVIQHTAAPAQTQAIDNLTIQFPRSFGYAIGDVIEQRITLNLNRPYKLSVDKLPQPGRITHWLVLAAPIFSSTENKTITTYLITLRYQIINIDFDTAINGLNTPEHKLFYSDGEGQFITIIPAWRFRVARLTDDQRPVSDLRNDYAPKPLQVPPYLLWLAGLGLLSAVAGLYYLYGSVPFLARHQGPFADAYRQLQQLSLASDAEYFTALRLVHQAFNQTAGQVLFQRDLASFFRQQSQFQRLRQPIEHYFAHTQQLFFTDHNQAQAQQHSAYIARYSLTALLALCHSCREIERGWQ